jgi:hypothetical protein
MPIDAILQAGIAGRVSAGQIVERERGRVGQDDAIPDDLNAALPVTDLAVVAAEDARALRDQQEAPGGCVE